MGSLKQPPPAYSIAIFNSTNFSFSCPNYLSIKSLTSPHKLPTSNTNTKHASVISEYNTKPKSHTTSPSPLALLCSMSLTPKLLNIKTSHPLAYPSILQYIIIHPLLLLTTNYLSTPNKSSYLNLLLIIINHHPHGIPFLHTFPIIIIIYPPLLIPACHN